MANDYQKINNATLKKLISQLKGSKEEQLDFLTNERKKRTDELRKEDPKTDIQNHPELDAYGMLYQSIANDHDPNDLLGEDNFTPPGAKIGVDNEFVEYSEKPKALTKDHIEKYGEEMLKTLGASDEQIAEAKKELDTNNNGEIEVDELADFQKSLDDYASKNKKGREDIPVTTRR